MELHFLSKAGYGEKEKNFEKKKIIDIKSMHELSAKVSIVENLNTSKKFLSNYKLTQLFYEYLKALTVVEFSFSKKLIVKDLGEIVETLGKKTESLIGALRSSRTKLKSQEDEIQRLKGKLQLSADGLEKTKEENKVLKMAAAFKGDEEVVSETKRKISQMVREIDRCIAKLND
tara:strand:- start:2137 stop:2658 length:522 start_codon:yes stop_codon:yes gene_type:complete